jgi:hypothetical protein
VNIADTRAKIAEFFDRMNERPNHSEEGAEALWDYAEADVDDLITLAGELVDALEDARREHPSIEIHYDSEDDGGSGEWAALYVNGELVTVGDSYVAEEKAFVVAGIETHQDSAFMRGQTQRSGVAQTLDEVAAYKSHRDEKLARAAELRAQAAALEAEARELSA